MARARRRETGTSEGVEERLSDNPFLPPVGPDRKLRFPADWTEEQKNTYVRNLRSAARKLKKKNREEGVVFQGETVTLRR